MLFTGYRTQGFFDEMFDADDSPRPIYADVTRGLSRITGRGFAARSAEVARHFTNHGITFGHTGMEQAFPFDLVPRIIPASEWAEISAGLVQRVIALDDRRGRAGRRHGPARDRPAPLSSRAGGQHQRRVKGAWHRRPCG